MYRELTMTDVREVLRRRQAGQALRVIARETGIDRKTVRRYVDAATQCGLKGDQALDDALVHEVARRVQVRPSTAPSEERQLLEPHRKQIADWLAGPDPLRLSKVHTLLGRMSVDVTYSTLRRFVRDELDWHCRTPSVRLEDPPPGQEAQIDFGEMGRVHDAETGKARRLWVLVVTLSYSRYTFVWPTFTQTVESVCEGLDAAWTFFGGVPSRIVVDNFRAVVAKADAQSPRISEPFADYAQARGFFVDPARVRRPQDKARVENAIAFVRQSWFAGEHFVDLDDARRSAHAWSRDVAGTRVHGTTRRVPRDVFEQEERSAMRPAPTEPFDVPIWTEATLHPDHHLQVARSLYSAPTRFIGQRLRVRADRATVRIYAATELIKVHPRKGPGERSTDVTDYPSGKEAYALRSVDALIERARKQGEHVGELVDRLLGCSLPWTRMRQAYRLLGLCERFGRTRVEEACRRALSFDVTDVSRIERMLRTARTTEEHAAEGGKLVQLELAPRFARPLAAFATKPGSDEEGGR
jgi:transposase